MIYHVLHRTILRYANPVRLARFNLRLRPAPWPGQWTSDYALEVDPLPSARSVGRAAICSASLAAW